MPTVAYFVVGDVHGRVLPAFKLATRWAQSTGVRLEAILQVGDLGYFPDLSRLDKGTRNHAKTDPTELGVQDIIVRTELADEVFHHPDAPPAMYFIAGNHEDYEALRECGTGNPSHPDYAVDAFGCVRCIRNGRIVELHGGVRVGGLWGVDGLAPTCRRNLPLDAYIRERAADELTAFPFDVLLCHDCPTHLIKDGYGSDILTYVATVSKPQLAFFGHYSGFGREYPGHAPTRFFHMAALELKHAGGAAEPGSAGVLTWDGTQGTFEYLPENWLRTFTRSNWKR